MEIPTSFEEIVDEITRHTAYHRKEVSRRVWMEAKNQGWNVKRDIEMYGVRPHHYDERMAQLYRDGDGFIFESLVFGSSPSRIRWTELAFERIYRHARTINKPADELSILMLGDGNGSDSLYFARKNLLVDYFEVPESLTVKFAKRRFENYGFLKNKINIVSSYENCLKNNYDVIVSFEVLEHLPDPLQAIQDIASMLKIGGLALISEDFGNLSNAVPTHVETTAKYLGQTPFLCLKFNLLLNWYSREELFKPYEFVRVSNVTYKDWLALWSDKKVRGKFLSRFTQRLKCLTSRSFEITG